MSISPEEFDELRQRLEALERRLGEKGEAAPPAPLAPEAEQEPPVRAADGQPSADVKALYDDLINEMGDAEEAMISVIVGCYRYGGSDRQLCWYSKNGKIPLELPIMDCSDEAATEFASIFSSAQRIHLLEALVGAVRSAGELRQRTGLGGGALYHHLRDLMHAGFVEQRARGRYALTAEGMKGLVTFLHVAADRSRMMAKQQREDRPSDEQVRPTEGDDAE